MIVRPEQFDAFRNIASRDFERRALAHLHTAFPEWADFAGDESLRGFIRLGARRARRWRITGSKDVCRFLDVMVALSPGFDDDPRLPWVRRILARKDVEAATRMDRLNDCVMQLLARTAAGHKARIGPDRPG